MRAQGYDGAANMSGIHRGVQARIGERISTAQYVHCKAHVLILVIVHSTSDVRYIKDHDGYCARNRIRLPILF